VNRRPFPFYAAALAVTFRPELARSGILSSHSIGAAIRPERDANCVGSESEEAFNLAIIAPVFLLLRGQKGKNGLTLHPRDDLKQRST
jgi:hypothetical protein